MKEHAMGKRVAEQKARLEAAMQRFEGAGVVDNGTYDEASTAYYPESNQLAATLRQNKPVVVRYIGTDSVMVAFPADGAKVALADAEEWIKAYRLATWPERYEMLSIDGPPRYSQVEIDAIMAAKASGHVSRVKMSAADESGVQVGGTGEGGVKRVLWHGHGGFALARWCGANGWTGKEALDVFEAIGIPLGKTAVMGGVYAGKKGVRGEPAPVTAQQAAVLEAKRRELGGKAVAPVAKVVAKIVVAAPVKGADKGAKRRAEDARLEAEVAKRKAAKVKGHRKG